MINPNIENNFKYGIISYMDNENSSLDEVSLIFVEYVK